MDYHTDENSVGISHRRWYTALSAAVCFICLTTFTVGLILSFILSPVEYIGSDMLRLLYTVYTIATIILFVVLFPQCVSLTLRLRLRYILYADRSGLHIHCGGATLGLIPWDNINSIEFESHGTRHSYAESLNVYVNDINEVKQSAPFYWRACNWVFLKNGDKPIKIDLSMCKGKKMEVAYDIISAWQTYTHEETE
jgi:hypothetical protein